jgi:hypothetical protein
LAKPFRKRLLLTVLIGIPVLYAFLLIPSRSPAPPPADKAGSFLWNQDEYWSHLEFQFIDARAMDSMERNRVIDRKLAEIAAILDSCENHDLDPASPLFDTLETSVFESAPIVAAQPDRLYDFARIQGRLRSLVKRQSRKWNVNATETRNRLYRLLYGSRLAVEEVILQADDDSVPALMLADDEPSATPSAEILGVTIHSGDILVSRGGAPTSALIARGNDYPGNFSHAALAYVDEQTGEVSIIESHIECGVAVASIDKYLKDTKLRILVLRLRHDLPAMLADPMLPHKAATLELRRARNEHIPYDFQMDFHDDSKLFCSEVVSGAYDSIGIHLWMGESTISTPGVRSWLAAFGVTHFQTQEPSDLEYDPQLTVVAEWRDPATLYKDHIDNAIIDAMLEEAESGRRLDYALFMLPIARLMKAYSTILNLFGKVGPIPEGMDATAALKNDRFSKRHAAVKERLLDLASDFKSTNGYRPPYWELVKLARSAISRNR